MFAECAGVGGLIAVAVGIESAIAHSHAPTSTLLASLMFGDAFVYLAVDTAYLRYVTAGWSMVQLLFLGAFAVSTFALRNIATGWALVAIAVEMEVLALMLTARTRRSPAVFARPHR